MRTIHLHPEHYLGIEIVPVFSRGDLFCRKGMEHIARLYPNVEAWQSKGLRGSGAIAAMAMSGYTLAVALDGVLPRFDRVIHDYDEHHHDDTHKQSIAVPRFIAFGESSTFAVFAELNDMAGIEHLWMIADLLDERTKHSAHRALGALTKDYHLAIADWHWKEWIDMRNTPALQEYLGRRYRIASRKGYAGTEVHHGAQTTKRKSQKRIPWWYQLRWWD